MSRDNEMKALLEQTRFSIDDRLQKILMGFVAVGIIGFIVGLIGNSSYLAWQALLVNTMFFGGIALCGLAFSLIFTITSAEWGRGTVTTASASKARYLRSRPPARATSPRVNGGRVISALPKDSVSRTPKETSTSGDAARTPA